MAAVSSGDDVQPPVDVGAGHAPRVARYSTRTWAVAYRAGPHLLVVRLTSMGPVRRGAPPRGAHLVSGAAVDANGCRRPHGTDQPAGSARPRRVCLLARERARHDRRFIFRLV